MKSILVLFFLPLSLCAQRISIDHIGIVPPIAWNVSKTENGEFLISGIGTDSTFIETEASGWVCEKSINYGWVARLDQDAKVIEQLMICVRNGELNKISVVEGQEKFIYVAVSGYGNLEINGNPYFLPGNGRFYVFNRSSLVFKLSDLKSPPSDIFLIEKSKFQDLKSDSKGNIYLAGDYYKECIMNGKKLDTLGGFEDESDQYLLKFDNDINLIWKKIFATEVFSTNAHEPVLPLDYSITIHVSKSGSLWYFSEFRTAIKSNDLFFKLPESKTGWEYYDWQNIGDALIKFDPETGDSINFISFKNRWDFGPLIEGEDGNIHLFPGNLEAMLNNNVISGPPWGLHGLIINNDTFPSKTLTYWHVIINDSGEIQVKNDFEYFPAASFHQVLENGSILMTYRYEDWTKNLNNNVNDLLKEKGVDYGYYLVKLDQGKAPLILGSRIMTKVFIDNCELYGLPAQSSDSFGVKNYPFPSSDGHLAGSYFIIGDICSDSQDQKDVFPPEIFLPNSFTPNGDDLNDVFEWRTISIVESTIKIYSREGGRCVYSGGPGWDGTFKGKILPIGLYGYSLEAVTNNGDIIRKNGTILLIR